MRYKILFPLLLCALVTSGCCSKSQSKRGGERGTLYKSASSHRGKSPEDYIDKGSYEDFTMSVGNKILFNHNTAKIEDVEGESQQNIIDSQIKWLSEYSEHQIVLEGHCDERGTKEYNLALGEKRAMAVKNYMVSHGIDPDRIKVVSYSKERPSVEGNNPEAWKLNRRVVVTFAHAVQY